MNPQQFMFLGNPSQGQFSGSTLHHGSSQHLLNNGKALQSNTAAKQSSEEAASFAPPQVAVTDNLVEGLKRDIRMYVEKCSMIVISSKTSAEESKARARARDE